MVNEQTTNSTRNITLLTPKIPSIKWHKKTYPTLYSTAFPLMTFVQMTNISDVRLHSHWHRYPYLFQYGLYS